MTEARKDDGSKAPLELIDLEAMEEVAWVLDFGRKKYGTWNWKQGFTWLRLVGAMLRHISLWSRGVDKDSDTGRSHMAHVVCCAMFLLWHEKHRPDLDDRSKV